MKTKNAYPLDLPLLRLLPLLAALAVSAPLFAQEEGHMHGPDGRHIAVGSGAGNSGGQGGILSHHDLKITDTRMPGKGGEGALVEGCTVQSIIFPKGDPNTIVHSEKNAYEPENGVYGSHMMYKKPGEYVLLEQITLPDKQEITLEFPIWVPDPHVKKEAAVPSPFLFVLGGVGLIALLAAVFFLGRRSGRRTVAALSIAALLTTSVPTSQAGGEGEAGHMHGPDGRHIAVPETFGEAVREPMKAYPSPDLKEFAVQTVGPYRFRLSIENEELGPPDPDVVSVSPAVAQTVGLTVVPVRAERGSGALVTTGQVRPNPNRMVTVNARVAGRVVRVGVTPGEEVAAGHVVAVLDSAEIAEAQAALRQAAAAVPEAEAAHRRALAQVAEARAGVDRARAEAAQAHTQVENAQAVLRRQTELARAGAFAQGPVEEARSAVAAAEGELSTARTALVNLEAQADRLEAGARDGVVARKEAEAARNAAEQGRTRVFTAERQLEIARAALAREVNIQRRGLRNAREVQQAAADLKSAQAAEQAANAVVQSEARRVQAVKSGAAETLAALRSIQTAVASARNQLRLLGATPHGGSQITITTPIGGEVASRPVNVGETVSAGQTLATILNTDSVWVESDVFEKDLPKVRVGQEVTIAADAVPGRTFKGRIGHIGVEVNPQTRAVRVRTAVENPGEVLKPNMFVRVLIGAGASRSILVPQEAVQEDGGERVVFVREAEGSFRRRAVRVGATLGDRVVIEAGLKLTDQVVTRGAYQLLSMAKRG